MFTHWLNFAHATIFFIVTIAARSSLMAADIVLISITWALLGRRTSMSSENTLTRVMLLDGELLYRCPPMVEHVGLQTWVRRGNILRVRFLCVDLYPFLALIAECFRSLFVLNALHLSFTLVSVSGELLFSRTED